MIKMEGKIIQATSRGQVTLPKKWRDQFDTDYYEAKVEGNKLVIVPLIKKETFEESLDEAWEQYKRGESMSHEELKKLYGL